MLVVTPKLMIGSFRLTVNESTVVVVPSTCKSPLTITVPSLLKPSGYGSIYNRFPCPCLDEIIFDEIPTPPNLASKA